MPVRIIRNWHFYNNTNLIQSGKPEKSLKLFPGLNPKIFYCCGATGAGATGAAYGC